MTLPLCIHLVPYNAFDKIMNIETNRKSRVKTDLEEKLPAWEGSLHRRPVFTTKRRKSSTKISLSINVDNEANR